MPVYLWVALGSGIGGAGRYAFALLASEWLGDAFPWGTVCVNAIGSFVIGFFATLTGADGRLVVRSDVRVFVMIGICGGYTTFSSFSLQNFLLLREGAWLVAGANVALSMIVCLALVWLGHAAATALNRPPVAAADHRRGKMIDRVPKSGSSRGH